MSSLNDFVWCDDEVDGEVVFGVGEVVIGDLQGMHGCDDDGGGGDQVGFLEESDFDVGVSGSFAKADTSPIDCDAAADDEIDWLEFVDVDSLGHLRGYFAGGGFGGWHGQ